MSYLWSKKILKKVLFLGNGCWLMSLLYKNYAIKQMRKKDIDKKCKDILIKNPEVLHYFGSINKMYMTNLNELNYNHLDIDILNTVEFLIEGSKRIGKVSIRYYLNNPEILKEFIKKQNENYELLLKLSDSKDIQINKELVEFNSKNILKAYSIEEGDKSVNSNVVGNPSNNNLNRIFNVSAGDFEKKKTLAILNNYFNFYYLNQSNNFAVLNRIDKSKIKDLEGFMTEGTKYLDEKINSVNKQNAEISEQQIKERSKEIFLPLYSYFINFLITKVNKRDQIDMFIQDIFIKKDFKYYSITPQNYDKKEYNVVDTDFKNELKGLNDLDLGQKKEDKIYKIASEFIKQKTIISQYDELTKNKEHSLDESEYEYNYPFIEEIFDGIQMDWRINCLLFGTLFMFFYYTLFSITQQKNYNKFDHVGRKILKYVKHEKGYNISNSSFFYFVWRTPLILNSERYLKIAIIDPAVVEKYPRTTLVMSQRNLEVQINQMEAKSNNPYH